MHSCPQQALRLVEYITEGFKSKQKTVYVFFDVTKVFDRTRVHTLDQTTNQSRNSSRLHPLSLPVLRIPKRYSASNVRRPTRAIRRRYRAVSSFKAHKINYSTFRGPLLSWVDGYVPGR
ncbi:hypothetical protein EVAR_80941_1 [Eumeta japonica]|uniref:Uncharacterized protein n=1 Tax=Eumeta variegata TaxID=151549 RepID=A0A4C1V097_EUMVA|nr:hypothetical protein EVAR_80941_1 [Eumeta japonica]